MNVGDLTAEQLDQLREQVGRAHRYIQALNERIQQRRFPYDDELRQRVVRADDALHGLWVSVHYLSCDRTAGLKPEHKPPAATAFRIDVVINEHPSGRPVDQWQYIEAETPFEALAKLARHGRLSPYDTFWVRIVPASDDDTPQNVVSVALTRELTTPMRHGDKSD
jgi:hypothetical protein